MARLEFDITGNVSGLSGAAGQAKGILANLQRTADALTIRLFNAETVSELNAVGGALQIVTGKIKEYTNEAIKGSQAFKDQQIAAALDNLSSKLTVITGNAQIFGASLQNNQQQIKAYQAAINDLLRNGVDPLDQKIKNLKSSIDALRPAPPVITPQTLGLIEAAEARLRQFQDEKRKAFTADDINRLNQQINHTVVELADLNNIGNRVTQTLNNQARTARAATSNYNSFGTALNYIIQDAPYAAYNFGAIGNNITQAATALPGYIAQLRATIIAQGGVATSTAIMRAGFTGLVTGFNGILLAISLATTAYTIYQQIQQKNARAAEDQANAVQKQKSALDNYLQSLNAQQQVQVRAVSNYAEEVTTLDLLFNSLQKNTQARYGAGTALAELQKLYPAEFGNLKEQEILTNKAAAAYERLRASIINAGLAEAAKKLGAESAEQFLKNNTAALDVVEKLTAAQARLNKLLELRKSFSDPQSLRGFNATYGDELDQLEKQVPALTKQYTDFTNAAIQGAAGITKFNNIANQYNQQIAPEQLGYLQKLRKELEQLQRLQAVAPSRAEAKVLQAQIDAKQKEIDAITGKGNKRGGAAAPRGLTLAQQLDNIGSATDSSAATAGLEGFEKQVESITQKYDGYYKAIQQYNARINANTKLTADERANLLAASAKKEADLRVNQTRELAGAELIEEQRLSSEKQRILDAFGVKSQENRAKELAAIDAQYNAEVQKAKGNAALLADIEAGRADAKRRINEKYLQEENDLQFKIQQIQAAADGVTGKKEDERTASIRIEWAKRKKEAIGYYDTLIKLAESDPTLTPEERATKVSGLQTNRDNLVKTLDNAEVVDIKVTLSKDFNDSLRRGIQSFGNDFYNTLSNINQQADKSFSLIFSNLTSKFSQTINEILINQFIKKITDNLFNSAIGGTTTTTADISKGVQQGAAKGTAKIGNEVSKAVKDGITAAALIGGAISGLTPKTSAVGQGLGGALSGAAAGAAIGGPIGAGIGGLIGGVGGLFGSKKARKEQEKIQQQQLEEQKKQTELLRQQAQAYSSQIIGRVTDQGTITKVEINGFGQLEATVSGRDLKFVLDREVNSR